MEQTPHGWSILDRDAGVLAYTYKFGSGSANAFVARYDGDKLLVLSPPYRLSEGDFAPLSQLAQKLGGNMGVIEAPADKCGETWAYAKTKKGYAWYASDTLANMAELPKALPFKLVMKLTKSAPGYRVFGLALKFIASDRRGLLRAMQEALRTRPVAIMVPAHGGILAHDGLAEETRLLIASAL